MKKFLAILLALSMVLSLAIPTFAAPTDADNLIGDYTAAGWGNDFVKYDSTKDAIVVNGGGYGNPNAVINTDSKLTSGKYIISFTHSANLDATKDSHSHICLLNADGANFLQLNWVGNGLKFRLNGNYTYDAGNGEESKGNPEFTSWTADTEYAVKVVLDIDNTTAEIYIDDELVVTVTGFRADFNGLSAIQFTPRAAANGTATIKDLAVKEPVVTPPTPPATTTSSINLSNFTTTYPSWGNTSYDNGVITYKGSYHGHGWTGSLTDANYITFSFGNGAENSGNINVEYADGSKTVMPVALGNKEVTVTFLPGKEVKAVYISCNSVPDGGSVTITLSDITVDTRKPVEVYSADIDVDFDAEHGFMSVLPASELATIADELAKDGAVLHVVTDLTSTTYWFQIGLQNTSDWSSVGVQGIRNMVVDTGYDFSILGTDLLALNNNQTNANVFLNANGAVLNASRVYVTVPEEPIVPGPGEEEEEEDEGRKSGYIVTGDETHAIIIGKAIITTKHEFDADGDCKYCRYHKDIASDDIEVVQPTESTEEETEDVTVEEPVETPATGIALAVIPAIVALAAVVISKR